MVMLLGSRGRARKSRVGSGWLSAVGLSGVATSLARWFGGPKSRDSGPRRSRGGWLALGMATICFGLGFVVGGKFGLPTTQVELRVPNERQPNERRPTVIGEFDARKLTGQAFVVALYQDADDAIAKDKAASLAQFLRNAGLPRTRPYLYPTAKGPLWSVAVYYEGEAEFASSRSLLLSLEQVPDAEFNELRRDRNAQGAEKDWPISRSIL